MHQQQAYNLYCKQLYKLYYQLVCLHYYQIASMLDARGTTTYQYDTQNRLTRLDYPDGNFIEYQYDLNGNRTLLTTAHQVVAYEFDALNRLNKVTDSNGITTYTFDAVGNRATQVNANGTTATYSYDLLNRLTNLVHTDSTNSIIASYAYTLGANGNRTRIEEATGRIVDYTYDNLYRLLTETITDPTNGNHFSQWSYDDVGNRLQQEKDGVITTYIYNNNDQIQSETENAVVTSYAYDNNGNTLSKTIGATLDTSYSYNKDNRLVQAITPTSTITNSYDAGGIRQSQTVDGTTTNYLVDQNRAYAQVLEEQNDLFIPQTTYVYGDDLISQTNAQGTHTFGYDGLGSTRILTDASGVVQNAYGYVAFGELDYQLGSIPNNYLFTGEQYDNNVGFYYLRARFYNPGNGRFTQMDNYSGRGFEPKTLHKYLYTHADPINNIDPSGNATISGLMAGLRNSAIQAAQSTARFGKRILQLLRRKKVFSIYLYQTFPSFNDLTNWHTYLYVERKGKLKGSTYDVDVDANRKPVFWPTSGYVKVKKRSRVNLPGTKLLRVARLTHGQRVLWHASVIGREAGRDLNRCDLSSYSVFVTNCTSWTVAASILAVAFSKIPL